MPGTTWPHAGASAASSGRLCFGSGRPIPRGGRTACCPGKVVGIVQPDYYSSGVAVFAHKNSGIGSWASLKGKKICGIQGAWYNKELRFADRASRYAFAILLR